MIFKQLKALATRIVAGANMVSVALLWLVGYSDLISPEAHPYLGSLGIAFPALLAVNLAFLAFWVFFRWRMIVIPVVGYLVALVPLRVYLPYNMPSEPPADGIKLVSYNVCCFLGDAGGEGDTSDDIFRYLKEADADIVCLQEVGWQQSFREQMQGIYPHSLFTQMGERKASTLAIYTRYPIVRSEPIAYPSLGNGSMAYYLLINRDTVLVVNNHFETTHLSLDERQKYKEMLKGEVGRREARSESRRMYWRLAESSRLRAPQADSVHAYVERHRDYPAIVCGDFNDSPISYTRRTVAKGLTDCFVSTGRGLGVSFNPKGFFVRIDHVMCSEAFEPYDCHVDNGVAASDHYPIICGFKKGESR